MKRFGLIGHPIGHSLSPALFNAAYGGRYVYDLIEGDDFGKSYSVFLDSYDGINVTAPFKELAFLRAGSAESRCRIIGAANLIVKRQTGTEAYNTDYIGVMAAILDAVVRCRPSCRLAEISDNVKKGHFVTSDETEEIRQLMTGLYGYCPSALVVGAGGAGKAAVAALSDMGLGVSIVNRSETKARDFLERSGIAAEVYQLDVFPSLLCESDLVVYTLPAVSDGFHDMLSGFLQNGSSGKCRPGKIILEANYRDPFFSGSIMDLLKERFPELKYVPGTVWLLYQASGGYSIFTGESPAMGEMEKIFPLYRINE